MEKKLPTVADYLKANLTENKTRVFLLKHKTINPSMIKVRDDSGGTPTGVALTYPNSYSLTAEAIIFDTDKKQQRIIRYVAGEASIYKDEQPEEKDVPAKVQRVQFDKGHLSVRREEDALMRFMLLHPLNESNPFRDTTKVPIFFEHKPEYNAEALMEADNKLLEATTFCHKEDFDVITRVATVMGCNMDQSPKEIRYELLIKAKRDPFKFIEELNNPTNKRKYFLMEAIKHSVLVVNHKENSINWKDGNIVCMAPVGIDPINHLVKQTLSDTRGEELYSLIESRLNPEIVNAGKTEEKFKIVLPTDDNKNLIKDAIEANVIEDKISWVFYKKGTAEERKWNGKKFLEQELSDNKDFKAQIIKEIAEIKITT